MSTVDNSAQEDNQQQQQRFINPLMLMLH